MQRQAQQHAARQLQAAARAEAVYWSLVSQQADRDWQRLRRKSKAHPPSQSVLLTREQQREAGQGLGANDVEEFRGVVTAIEFKDGKMKIEVETGKDKTEEIVADWKTLFYQLTKRNVKLFAKDDHFEDVLEQINAYQKVLSDLSEKDLRLRAAYMTHEMLSPDGTVRPSAVVGEAAALGEARMRRTKDEEDRRRLFGPPIRLRKDMTVRAYVGKRTDVTYMILVEAVPERKR
jgi:hypothetical protein